MEGTLAVVSQTGESLSLFDISSGTRIAHLPSLISEPHELVYDRTRHLLYMSHAYRHGHYWSHGEDSHEISVVDLSTNTITSIIDVTPYAGPHGLCINTAQDILYVSVEVFPDANNTGGIIGIDLTTHTIVKRIPSGFRSHWFAMTPDGKKAYTCNKTARYTSVLDLENQVMLGKIELPTHEEPSVSRDGRYVYFPTPGFAPPGNPEISEIYVVDTGSDAVVGRVSMKYGALPIHVCPRGDILVGQYRLPEMGDDGIVTPGFGVLAKYHGDSWELVGEASVGKWVLTVRCSDDGRYAFAANVADGTVSVVELEGMKTVKTIVVDPVQRADKNGHVGAHGLAFIPPRR